MHIKFSLGYHCQDPSRVHSKSDKASFYFYVVLSIEINMRPNHTLLCIGPSPCSDSVTKNQ